MVLLQDISMITLALCLLGFGGLVCLVALLPAIFQPSDRHVARRRLQANPAGGGAVATPPSAGKSGGLSGSTRAWVDTISQRATGFYSSSDPDGLKRAQMMMVRAGWFSQGAVGYFFAARVLFAGVALMATYLLAPTDQQSQTGLIILCTGAAAIGYMLPGWYLKRRARKMLTEARAGFPDFMDLMVVCSNAGMSLEASINRVVEELSSAYPVLATHLSIVTLEMRAGRPLEDALGYLYQRIPLDEIRAFSNLLQQSKELGSPLTDALRVYSDDMRHQRMSKAEEKAYALPAKLSVPVSVCILPVVLFIAVLPSIVRWNVGV